jgi:hypothetical protein
MDIITVRRTRASGDDVLSTDLCVGYQSNKSDTDSAQQVQLDALAAVIVCMNHGLVRHDDPLAMACVDEFMQAAGFACALQRRTVLTYMATKQDGPFRTRPGRLTPEP